MTRRRIVPALALVCLLATAGCLPPKGQPQVSVSPSVIDPDSLAEVTSGNPTVLTFTNVGTASTTGTVTPTNAADIGLVLFALADPPAGACQTVGALQPGASCTWTFFLLVDGPASTPDQPYAGGTLIFRAGDLEVPVTVNPRA